MVPVRVELKKMERLAVFLYETFLNLVLNLLPVQPTQDLPCGPEARALESVLMGQCERLLKQALFGLSFRGGEAVQVLQQFARQGVHRSEPQKADVTQSSSGPGQGEGLGTRMRRHVTVDESTVAATPRGVTGRSMMKTGDDIPELSDPIRTGLDVPSSGANLTLPPLDHGTAARYHKGVV